MEYCEEYEELGAFEVHVVTDDSAEYYSTSEGDLSSTEAVEISPSSTQHARLAEVSARSLASSRHISSRALDSLESSSEPSSSYSLESSLGYRTQVPPRIS